MDVLRHTRHANVIAFSYEEEKVFITCVFSMHIISLFSIFTNKIQGTTTFESSLFNER